MPFGVQLIGRFRGDRELLGAAHAIERAFEVIPDLRRPIPNLKKLSSPAPTLQSIVTHPPAISLQ